MTSSTSLAVMAVASIVNGGVTLSPPPPPPQMGFGLQKPYEAFFRLNEPLRFFISGNAGNVVFYHLDVLIASYLAQIETLPAIVREYKDSVSFFIAYFLQVIPQHWFHALLVYGLHSIDTREKYFKTLLGNYSAYMTSLVGSTILNTFFVKTLKLNKTVAFVVTLWTFAVLNYFVIGWVVANAATPKSAADPKSVIIDAKKSVYEKVDNAKTMADTKVADAKKKADEMMSNANRVLIKGRGGARVPYLSCDGNSQSLHMFVTSLSESVKVD